MRILRFKQFTENLSQSPEEYINLTLMRIKNKINKIFGEDKNPNDNGYEKASKDTTKLSQMGVSLESCELSKYSKVQDNLRVKFSEEHYYYDLTFSINLEDAVSKPEEGEQQEGSEEKNEKDFKDTDITKCYLIFKKYKIEEFELVGQLSKTIKIKDINVDLLFKLKTEVDKEFGGDDEEFEVETE